MENIQPKTRKVVKISRKKFIITAIVVIVILLAIWGFSNRMRPLGIMKNTNVDVAMPTVSTSAPGIMMEDGSYQKEYDMMPYPPDYYGGQPSVKDTREFLKTSYSAEIKTRDVSDTVRDVKNAVAGADGRIDGLSSSEKYGYVNFVVAKDKFDAFKDEIESLVPAKLYVENISSQNLLGQKQNIEEQADSITKSLADLEKSKKDLDAKHTATVKSLKNQLDSTQAQLVVVRQNILNTQDSQQLAILRSQENTLMQRESDIKQNQNTESQNYARESKNLENQIKWANDSLEGNIKQDIKFGENIETVNGYVSINWVSCWEVMKLYSPIHPTIIIVIIVLGILYAMKRKKVLPRIELV